MSTRGYRIHMRALLRHEANFAARNCARCSHYIEARMQELYMMPTRRSHNAAKVAAVYADKKALG